MAMALGDVAVVLSLDDAALRRGLAGVRSRMGAFGSRMARNMRRVGRVAGLALIGGLVVGVKAGADFEDAMAKSVAIMGDMSDEMRDKMETAAREIALTTALSAQDAAESYYYLASAGLDAAAALEALPVVAAFAQAGAFDMALATDILTDAQSALGMTIRDDVVKNMENMNRVGDVLVKTATLANATVQQLGESMMTKVGAAFRDAGKDVEEAAAVLGVMADQGIKGRDAGTKLTMMMTQLSLAAVNNRDAFAKWNIAVYDSRGEMRHWADIVGDMEGAFEGLSMAQKVEALQELGFQARTANTMKLLLGTSDAIRTLDEANRDAADTMQSVADKQLESFNAQLGLVKDAFLDIGLSIFDGFVKPLSTSLIPKIGDAARAIGEFIELVGERGLRRAIGETFGWDTLLELDGFLESIDNIKKSVGNLWDKFKEFWKDIEPDLKELAAQVLPAIETTIGKVEVAWEEVGDEIAEVVKAIANIGTAILEAYNGDWREAWDGMKEDSLAVKIAIGAIIIALGRLGIAAWLAQANFTAAMTGGTGMVIAAKQVTAAVVGIKAALVALVTTPWVLTLGIAVLAPLGIRRLMDELTGGGETPLPWDIPLPWEEPPAEQPGGTTNPGGPIAGRSSGERPSGTTNPGGPIASAFGITVEQTFVLGGEPDQSFFESIRRASSEGVLEGAAAAGLMV